VFADANMVMNAETSSRPATKVGSQLVCHTVGLWSGFARCPAAARGEDMRTVAAISTAWPPLAEVTPTPTPKRSGAVRPTARSLWPVIATFPISDLGWGVG